MWIGTDRCFSSEKARSGAGRELKLCNLANNVGLETCATGSEGHLGRHVADSSTTFALENFRALVQRGLCRAQLEALVANLLGGDEEAHDPGGDC